MKQNEVELLELIAELRMSKDKFKMALAEEISRLVKPIIEENSALREVSQKWLSDGRFLSGNSPEKIELVEKTKEALR